MSPVTRALLASMARSALVLAAFTLLGTVLVVVMESLTAASIAAQERQQLLRALGELLTPDRYDNQLERDSIRVHAPAALGTPDSVLAYRARKNGQPVALLLPAVAPDGYSGNIRMLVGINADGTLAGVRVTDHRETPGLGDAVELARSDWIRAFTGRSLDTLAAGGWRVRKDGGEFDQFSGATITPRAVVAAVYRVLRYYRDHREELFAKQ